MTVETGPQGIQGPSGPQGVQGEPGPAGPSGDGETGRLIENSLELADRITLFQKDIDAQGQVEALTEKTDRKFRKVLFWRFIMLSGLVMSLSVGVMVAYNAIRLNHLVRNDCIRAERSELLAEFRDELIKAQPENVQTELRAILEKLPKVEC